MVCGNLPAGEIPLRQRRHRRLTLREVSPALEGFRADTAEKLGHLDHWKNGWLGQKPGDKITFAIDASCIAVQYRKTIRRPALQAQLVLDGDAAHPILLDGSFDEDWGDCLYLQPILHHGAHKTHTVELTILPTDTPDATAFYLLALIAAGASKADSCPLARRFRSPSGSSTCPAGTGTRR